VAHRALGLYTCLDNIQVKNEAENEAENGDENGNENGNENKA